MTLISLRVNDIHVTAMTIGEHFALSPAILVDQETGELSFDTATWYLHHRPSETVATQLHQSDPYEFPGEPRAISPIKAAAFVKWLESRIDCSDPKFDLSGLTHEDQRVIGDFNNDPNYFTVPGAEAESKPLVDAPPVSFGDDGFTVTM